jgi:3-deoxy-manno-octulosonate cytidylyltransferase (CMP-KDO synthetase)
LTVALPAVHALIPVRLASKRFPNKPLFPVGNQPLLECLVESVVSSKLFSSVTVVSEDRSVLNLAGSLGVGVCDVAGPFRNGTSRVCAAVQALGLGTDLVVNIQGDMPGIDPLAMASLIESLRGGQSDAVTLARSCYSVDERLDVNRVKVVVDHFGNALYFSRAGIPFGAAFSETLIHIGVYGFVPRALSRYVACGSSPLSNFEDLEQLDWLGAGLKIGVVTCDWGVPSLDGPEDALLVCAWHQER